MRGGGGVRKGGSGGKSFEEGTGVGEEGAAGIGGENIVEDLASGLGPIFLNLDAGETEGGAGAEGIERAIGEDAEVEGLGGGAVSAGGELVGLGEAGGGGEGVFRKIAEELFVEAGGLARICLGGGLGGGF